MNKDKIIALIEQELVQADEADNEAEFQKHMYAIHTLTSLYTEASPISRNHKHQRPSTAYTDTSQMSYAAMPAKQTPASYQSSGQSKVTAAEIEAMGGKVKQPTASSNTSTPPGNSNKMITDDELGNGDSIFDF